MRNTFLVFNDPTNPGAGLRVAKPQEWDQILKKNKTLPREQRRFFITDAFEDCGEIDCMYIETTQEEYNKWHSQKVESERKRKLGEEYGKISFEQQAPGTEFLFSDIIGDGFDLEKAVHDKLTFVRLRNALMSWKSWAVDLLDLYVADMKTEASYILSDKYDVSVRTVQRWKGAFEEFVKNFFEKL